MNAWNELNKGIVRENPVLTTLLGLCPTLAVTTTVINGLGMGLATTFVLMGSNMVISLLASRIPPKVRIPVYVVIIATFVTIVDSLIQAFSPELNKSLGIFIPLIVVNCIVLGRAEAFASRNRVWPSLLDALGMGVGFTLALLSLATIREILGSGSVLGIKVMGDIPPLLIFVLPPGAFLILGFIIAGVAYFSRKKGVE